MEEKKSTNVNLWTAVCIFILFIILIVALGVVCYLGIIKNNEKISALKDEVNDLKTKNSVTKNVTDETKSNVTKNITEEANSNSKINSSFSEGTYSYFLDNNYAMEGRLRISFMQKQITFLNNKFSANIGDFIVKGDYELLNNNEMQCDIKSHSFIRDEAQTEYSINENWTIIFSISDNKIKVKKFNCDTEGESELLIELFDTFGEENEFIKYNEKDFTNTWNSKYYYNPEDKKLSDNLMDIFGSSVKYGSYLKLLDNNKFEDYVHPVTENNKYRSGTYTFDGCNKFTLKYDDNSRERNVYIIDNNTLQYDDVNNSIVLTK